MGPTTLEIVFFGKDVLIRRKETGAIYLQLTRDFYDQIIETYERDRKRDARQRLKRR